MGHFLQQHASVSVKAIVHISHSKAFSLSHKGPQLQSADRDSEGPGEQQKYAGPESEPQWHRLHPQPAVHQPNRPVVSGPERQQAGQPAPPDETPGSPSDPHTE